MDTDTWKGLLVPLRTWQREHYEQTGHNGVWVHLRSPADTDALCFECNEVPKELLAARGELVANT